jgi:succinoglycan biosynthesis protein ExoW
VQATHPGGDRRPSIAVVIPYYQREPGVLRRAVNAALRQRRITSLSIVIVDDGSPWPAQEELKDLPSEQRVRLTVLTQRNAGPGAARNVGLESLDHDTTYVAFLDSDDVWAEGHLENAIVGLEKGYDFYFSDFRFSDYKTTSAFARARRIDPAAHDLLDMERGLYAYRGDMLDQILVRGNVIGTPTVVYRFSKYPALRFREEFYNGQDYLFWLDFSRLSSSIVFSTQVECDCGVGVNIYSGAGWGSDRSLQRLKNELLVWKSVPKIFTLTTLQRGHNRQRVQKLREAIVRDLLHRLAHRKQIQKNIVLDILRIDPFIGLSSIPILARIALERMISQ